MNPARGFLFGREPYWLLLRTVYARRQHNSIGSILNLEYRKA
jgi:hypothetical protein